MTKQSDLNKKLLQACRLLGENDKQYALIKSCLNEGANVNEKHDFGWSALIKLASSGGDARCAQLLIDNGAQINQPNDNGQDALMWAANSGHEVLVALLIKSGAKVDAQDNTGKSALMSSALCSRVACAHLLLDSGASMTARDNDGLTALHHAARSHQGFVNETSLDNVTSDKHDCVRKLIACGAQVDALDNDSMSPLTFALLAKCALSVKSLVMAGANITLKTRREVKDQFYTADRRERSDLVSGAFLAAQAKDPASLHVLAEAGADLEAESINGKTLLQIAKENHWTNVLVAHETSQLRLANTRRSPSSEGPGL